MPDDPLPASTPLDYQVVRPDMLDRKLTRASLLGVALFATALGVSQITWETPAPAPVQDATFGQVKITIVHPPVPPAAPSDAGGSQAVVPMPAMPTPPVAITTPRPNMVFRLPKVSLPNGVDILAPEATSGGHGTSGQGSGTGTGIGAGNDAGISTGDIGAFAEALPHDGRHILGAFPMVGSMRPHVDIHNRPELKAIEWDRYHAEDGWVADFPADHSGDSALFPAILLGDLYRKTATVDDQGERHHQDIAAIVWVDDFATPEGDVIGVRAAMERLQETDSSVKLYVIAYGRPYSEVIDYVRKSGGMIFYPDQLDQAKAALTK